VFYGYKLDKEIELQGKILEHQEKMADLNDFLEESKAQRENHI